VESRICGGSRTSGSEGGPRKPTSRKADRAPRSDPYTEHPTHEGKVYCAVVLDVHSRRAAGWSIDSSQTAALATNGSA
jgi:putative transposase